MAKEITVSCDICGGTEEVTSDVQIPCTFTTEQTEGRGVEPYIVRTDPIDVCKACMHRIINEQPVIGNGAQGHNNYQFRKKE